MNLAAFLHANTYSGKLKDTLIVISGYIQIYVWPLKLVSAIFYQVFVFPPNDSRSKTMKSVFYFIKKALFVLKIFKIL